jgi:addiction module RelE/StbE family toxin
MGEVRPLRLRYTKRALRQLFTILSYIEDQSPKGAANVQRRIQQSIDLLQEQPHIGTMTQRIGYRRVVLNPYPYVVLYQPTAEELIIHSIRHASRKRRGW